MLNILWGGFLMTKDEIKDAIYQLSKSQGWYDRLYNSLTDEFLEYLERQNFTDVVDMVIFLES